MDMRLPDRPSMLQYRLYCLGGDGSFTKVHEIEARSDADALEQARDMKLGVQCELWARNRLVAELAPDGSLNGKPHVADRIN